MAKTFLLIAALNGFIAVALGAFGAHGLKQRLAADMLAVYQTGVQYHFYHTFALLVVALLLSHVPLTNISITNISLINALRWSGIMFALGIVIFSGSLYVLSITGIRWLGAITPLGGLAFLVGWLLLARAAWLWTDTL